MKRVQRAEQLRSQNALIHHSFRQVRRFKTGGYVSATPTLADLDGDGRDELVAGSDAVYVWRLDGALLPGFPVYGTNYFASRPVVADIDQDGQMEIVIGCDDDCVYVFKRAGQLLPGWPQKTGGDVYSCPVVADLNGDGLLEIVVGSDDGGIYVWRADGTVEPGWPQFSNGFISASPRLADINGDGQPEVIAGSWDHHVYAWHTNGRLMKGWPCATGNAIWSAVELADLDGDGCPEVLASSDGIYAWRHDGAPANGWPQATRGFIVGSPHAVDLNGDGQVEIIAAGDQLYAWDLHGEPLPGYPAALDGFCWHQPAMLEARDESNLEVVTGLWDGNLHTYSSVGVVSAPPYSTDGALFAAPLVIGSQIFVASWDGCIHWLELSEDPSPARSAQAANRTVMQIGEESRDLGAIAESVPAFVQVIGPLSNCGILHYRRRGEDTWHPSPLVIDKGVMTALVQPYLAGSVVELWAEITDENGAVTRYPRQGMATVGFRRDLPARVLRRLRRLGLSV